MAVAPEQAPIEPNVTMTSGTHPFSTRCPRFDCNYVTAHASLELAEMSWDQHLKNCPMEGKTNELMDERDERGQRYTVLRVGKSILEKLWDSLDTAFIEFNKQTDQMTLEYYKGRMRGLAESIQMMSSHYFPTTDDVVREELKRNAIRKGEREFEPTPGYRYNPPPIGTAAYEKANKQGAIIDAEAKPPKRTARKATTAAKKPELLPSVSPEVEQKIKNALGMGLFTDDDIATSFKLPISYIKTLRESIDSQ